MEERSFSGIKQWREELQGIFLELQWNYFLNGGEMVQLCGDVSHVMVSDL